MSFLVRFRVESGTIFVQSAEWISDTMQDSQLACCRFYPFTILVMGIDSRGIFAVISGVGNNDLILLLRR